MPINATCQQCGAMLPVPEEYAGRAVRCGGCQGVVNVPAIAEAPPAASVPVAKAARPRPVAVPVARAKPAVKAEAPIPKARKAKDENDESLEIVEDDEPKKRAAVKRRPIAKRRRETVFTPTALKWLTFFLLTGLVGLVVMLVAAWGTPRKPEGTTTIRHERIRYADRG